MELALIIIGLAVLCFSSKHVLGPRTAKSQRINLSASAVVIHYEEALYQVYAFLPFNRSGQNFAHTYCCTEYTCGPT